MFPSVVHYLSYHGELVSANRIPQYIQVIGRTSKQYVGSIVQVDGHRESRLGVVARILNHNRVEVVGVHNGHRWTATVHIEALKFICPSIERLRLRDEFKAQGLPVADDATSSQYLN